MTRSLKRAIRELSSLSVTKQNEIAKIILAEIENEKIRQFKSMYSPEDLSIIAEETLNEHYKMRTRKLRM
jgi:hypothetical protein